MTKKEKKHRRAIQTIDGGKGEIVIYQPGDGGGHLEVRLEQESLWLSLNQIATVFERDKSVISRHLNNVFREGELDRGSTVAFLATVRNEGGRTVERQAAGRPAVGGSGSQEHLRRHALRRRLLFLTEETTGRANISRSLNVLPTRNAG